MTMPAPAAQEAYLRDTAVSWITRLQESLDRADANGIRSLFEEQAYWRDLLAFTGDVGWIDGADVISDRLAETAANVKPQGLRISEGRTPPGIVRRAGREVLEFFVQFDTVQGPGEGVVRLLVDDSHPDTTTAWTLLTILRTLHAHPERSSGRRIPGTGFDRSDTRVNWLDRRKSAVKYDDHDPEVLIVGGGHAGVMLAAYLGQLDVDALVIDRLPRAGDSWRTRYHSLVLHNPTDAVQFPFLPYPTTFPDYLPKDKLANWIEVYVEQLEINFWSSTEFISAEYTESEERWKAVVRADGVERIMRPRHVVIATGGEGGTPSMPDLPGLADFRGEVVHSKYFASGSAYADKRVLVVGVSTSAHDVALDLYTNGAQVTMLQRNPTVIVSLDSANLPFTYYTDGRPTDEADLLAMANFIYPILRTSLQELTATTNERDRDLLERLRAAGMRIDNGDEETGWLMKFFRYRGGYYIDVGCSELIAQGDIRIIQTVDIDRFTADGISFDDGRTEEFDAIVCATGYGNVQEELRGFFGDEVADRVGPIGGFDDDLELRNLYRRTAQPGLWINTGGLPSIRHYARFLALQIQMSL